MELKKYKLGELCIPSKIGIYGIPASAEDFSADKIRYLRISDISDDGILLDNDKKSVTGKDVDKYILEENDIVFARTGNSTGRAYLYDSTDGILAFAGFLIKYQLDATKVNPKFIRYFTISEYYKQWVKNLSVGSTRGNISAQTFADCPILLPSREQQNCTVNILSSLDRKIELNRAINQNLEAMAKQLYDYWFVQFDFPNEEGKPYKSSGGKMKWDNKLNRNIPKDWHCGNLFEIAAFTNGLACQKYRPQKGEKPLPVIKIREMHDGITSDTEKITPNIPEKVKVYNGDVLFSWSASLEVKLWAYGLGGLNQHIFKVSSANGFPKSFYYFQLLDYVDVFKKVAEARKTTMGHITQDHLQQSTIAVPDNKNITDKFELMVSPIFKQLIRLQEEISSLTKQRDELLPLLMNGQITIE